MAHAIYLDQINQYCTDVHTLSCHFYFLRHPRIICRVFTGDEAIDTTTCSIGSDTSQLPEEARIRAQKEHERFASLTKAEQEAELDKLAAAKKVSVQCQ
jgi:hypothetical protein